MQVDIGDLWNLSWEIRNVDNFFEIKNWGKFLLENLM